MQRMKTALEDSSATAFAAVDSLAYLLGKPELSAEFKTELADFKVDEKLGFTPVGAGDHFLIRIRKRDLATTEVARMLAHTANVRLGDVGYSGMKDRRGECSQWFSVKVAHSSSGNLERDLKAIESPGLEILELQRNNRKLSIGSHKANRFCLLLRNCLGEAEEYERRLSTLSEAGMPNYFGAQRFGRQMNNLYQAQELFAAEDSRRGAGGRDGRKQRRGMLYSASRSFLFNQILSRRVQESTWDRYLDGDVLNLDGTDRCFLVAPDEWDAVLQQRLEELDIHPTAALPGEINSQDKYVPRGKTADMEDAVCQNYATLLDGLQRHGVGAARRALRCKISDMCWNWQEKHLEIQFSLPRGAYATSLLRELCILQEFESLESRNRESQL